jgi:hypothetical protein
VVLWVLLVLVLLQLLVLVLVLVVLLLLVLHGSNSIHGTERRQAHHDGRVNVGGGGQGRSGQRALRCHGEVVGVGRLHLARGHGDTDRGREGAVLLLLWNDGGVRHGEQTRGGGAWGSICRW